MYVVDVTTAHSFTKATPFEDEDLAIAYARGLVDGFHLAKLALDHGLRWDGTINEGEAS